MTTFFSVDVETSDTRLGASMAHLLTIGVQPVVWEPRKTPEMLADRFYVRVDHPLKGWPTMDASEAQTDTHRWWLEQSEEARNEAYADTSLLRHPRHIAAKMLDEFCRDHEADAARRIFVANPVAFDKPWIDLLMAESGIDGTFHYRSLCLRSMKFGLRISSEWGSDRENHQPVIPHHAYWDAKAQALDLIDMLNERDAAKESPSQGVPS